VAAARDSETDMMASGCMVDLAWVDLQLGNYAAASAEGRQGLELEKKVYGRDHVYVAYTLRILAAISRQRGDYRQAQTIMDESIAVMETNSAGENELAPFLVDLADVLVAQGKYDDAEKTYLEAMEKVVASLGTSHLYTATVMTHIAGLYARQQRFDEARQLLDAAYPTMKEVFGDDSYALVDTWMTMAAISEHDGDLPRAENMIKRALGRVEKQYGEKHPEAARILGALGEFCLDHGDYVQAAAICPVAVEKLQASLGEDHDATAMAMNDLARLYAWQGRMADASRLCTGAVTRLAQIFEPTHPSMTKVRHTLTSLLVAKAPGDTSSTN
jgi:tetratricopeptide (TPR) repeat protein